MAWLRTTIGAVDSVLHLMCGPGLFAQALHRNGVPRCLGIDYATATVRHAGSIAELPDTYEFVRADITVPESYPEDRFDLAINAYESLNHFPREEGLALLRRWATLVRPGGHLVVEARFMGSDTSTYRGRVVTHEIGGSGLDLGDHFLLDEVGILADGSAVGHRLIVVPCDRPDRATIFNRDLSHAPILPLRSSRCRLKPSAPTVESWRPAALCHSQRVTDRVARVADDRRKEHRAVPPTERRLDMTTFRKVGNATVLASVAVLIAWLGLVGNAAAGPSPAVGPAGSAAACTAKPTVVLVHGAWAGTSSWNGEVERLRQQGYAVRAFANPLRGLTGDMADLAAFLNTIHGPIVLVGHSYGGSVITNAAAGNGISRTSTIPT